MNKENQFDWNRQGTGTKEWSDVSVNIQRGCRNNCRYCYAAWNAVYRFKQVGCRDLWRHEELTKFAQRKMFPHYDTGDIVMFPTTHDITNYNLVSFIRVAKLILQAGNHLLIVSKPRIECINRLLVELEEWKDNILFRFTIGSLDTKLTAFWEPGARTPRERIECLCAANYWGYETSVSIEPMLAGKESVIEIIDAVDDFVSEKIWIGKMNCINSRVEMDSQEVKKAVALVKSQQSDSEILSLYNELYNKPNIAWKDSIVEVIKKVGA